MGQQVLFLKYKKKKKKKNLQKKKKNRDTLKTQPKCQKVATEFLKNGKSVVIDNTNPEEKTRKEYIKIAEKFEVPVRCFHFDTPVEIAEHLNFYREKIIGTRRVPPVNKIFFLFFLHFFLHFFFFRLDSICSKASLKNHPLMRALRK